MKITLNEQVANARLIAQAPAMREALQKLSEAVRPTRDGKRDGGTFGALSAADDAARAILRAIEGA
jgi:hypothetical protein